MQVGMIGLGRMGANLARRLANAGHQCVVYDRNAAAVEKSSVHGVQGASSLQDLVAKLPKPRVLWLMVPVSVVEAVLDELSPYLDEGDIVIDGGNSYYRDDIHRSRQLAAKGIHYIDCGTSGGVYGLERGYCLMIGGDEKVVRYLEPIFQSLAPGVDAAPRTPGREGEADTAEYGYLHCGPSGAGHFVKMVHNGIEYGLMAAYAEGLNVLRHANTGKQNREADAETSPMTNPEYYQYDLDLPRITELWRRGSVVGSWLLDLTATALQGDADLAHFGGRVSDSGEGRWTVAAAIDEGVPVPVLSAALFERFSSQGGADFGNRVLSAMRKQFGGHDEKHDKR